MKKLLLVLVMILASDVSYAVKKPVRGAIGPMGPQGPMGPAYQPKVEPCAEYDFQGSWYFTDADVMTKTIEQCTFNLDSQGNSVGGSCNYVDINGNSGTVQIIGGGVDFVNQPSCNISSNNINLSNGNILQLRGWMSPTKVEMIMMYVNSNGARGTFTAVKR